MRLKSPPAGLTFARLTTESRLLWLLQRRHREVGAFEFASPPFAPSPSRGRVREAVFVNQRSDVPRRPGGERVLRQQRQNRGGAFHESHHEVHKPAALLVAAERRKPHL